MNNRTLEEIWGVAPVPPKGLPPLSEEQRIIVDAVRGNKCVRITAYAGTGKSTTALCVVCSDTNSNLILTYNRALADEVNEMIRKFRLANVACRTYHAQVGISAGMRGKCSTDAKLLEILRRWESKMLEVARPICEDRVILDEVQDMRPSFYRAVMQMVSPNRQMLVLGDEHQMLYDYGAHDRACLDFLARPHDMFATKTLEREWVSCRLSTSYRLSAKMTRFINLMWGTDIRSGNFLSDIPVEYWCINMFDPRLIGRLRGLIDGCENWEDVAFLSPMNLRSPNGTRRPLQWIINQLLLVETPDGDRRYNFAIKNPDGGSSDYKNKVRVWTYNASKGCTIKCTVVFGFSAYKGRQPGKNPLGVAISRSNHRLIVVHDRDWKTNMPNPYCKPLTREILTMLVDDGVVVARDGVPEDTFETLPTPDPAPLTVTMITHLSAETIGELLAYGHDVHRSPPTHDINVRLTHDFHTGLYKTVEDVSAIYGVALPFALEDARKGGIALTESMLNPLIVEPSKRFEANDIIQMLRDASIAITLDEMDLLRSEFESPVRGSKVIEKLRLLRNQHAFLSRVCVCDRRRFDQIFAEYHMERVLRTYNRRAVGLTPTDYMYLANAFIAIEGTHELFVQIGVDYSWVDDDAFVDALAALEASVPDGQHECIVSAPIVPHVVSDRHVVDAMIGIIDVCVDSSTAYELKFVRELTYEHELQALIYAAILAISNNTVASCVLFNARTGESIGKSIEPDPARTLLRHAAEARVS